MISESGEGAQPDQAGPYTLTRGELVQALKAAPVTGTLAMLESQGGTAEDLADAIIQARALAEQQQGERSAGLEAGG